MISWTSCSRRARRAPAALALALALGCGGARPAGGPAGGPPRARIALLPVHNLSGAQAPLREIEASLELALARRGFEVVSGQAVDVFLASHRLRNTGAIDAQSARAARDELGVEGVLVTSVELYSPSPARFALTSRLVSADETAELRWMDGVARAGSDTKTFLGLGVVDRVERLRDEAAATLARSLARRVEGDGPRAPRCEAPPPLRPRTRFRAPELGDRRTFSVAVLPFVNDTRRSGAGEAVTLAIVRQLSAVENLRVLEPGVVRRELLRFRMILENGVSLEHARLVSDSLDADLVVTGQVREFDDHGVPRANFSVIVLERSSRRIVWDSTSYAAGNDLVVLFDLGRISTASALTCGMAQHVVERMGFAGARARPDEATAGGATEGGAGSVGYASSTQSLRTAESPPEQK